MPPASPGVQPDPAEVTAPAPASAPDLRTHAGEAASAGSGGAAGSDDSDAGAAPSGSAGQSAPAPRKPSYLLGADITDQEPAPAAVRANLLALLQAHGFNAIRLRTFVDPRASDGYDQVNGYGDLAHTIEFARQVKAARMSLLIDFHYSDNWADPGKQCVPVAWQNRASIEELAAALHDYTQDAVSRLVAAGARPDLVQIGNEITPGMLLHRCDRNGQPTGMNPVTGSTSSWKNLGKLLQAGVSAVREIDPAIAIALHIDRGGDKPSDTKGAALQASTAWLMNASSYVEIDVFALSCYQRYQGDPADAAKTKAGWSATFQALAAKFPKLRLIAAEYGPMQREINDVVYGLPNQAGAGTFNWEPTTRGDWNTGHDLLRRSGDTYAAQPDLQLYDRMKQDYAERL
ncbi:MAG TPA: glycosyl hydrolase 53 family protein [Polyangiales bacterium]|nr:glycosyl hydrolase 53 family protein [Polyangiales bacterium]